MTLTFCSGSDQRSATLRRSRQVWWPGNGSRLSGKICEAGVLSPNSATVVNRLIGVYAADGTALGEISYWINARLGRAHCSLCDITHGLLRERSGWKEGRAGLAVPFETFHRNDQPEAVLAAAGDRTPVVLAETDAGMVLLLRADEIAACGGSPVALIVAIEKAVEAADLVWP